MPFRISYGPDQDKVSHLVTGADEAVQVAAARWHPADLPWANAVVVECLSDGQRRVAIDTPQLAKLVAEISGTH